VTYQWSRSGVAISGATAATYAIGATQLADSGTSFTVAVTNAGGTTVSSAAGLTVNAVASSGATAQRLFSDQSLWNARPTQFTLGTYVIPPSSFYPQIGPSAYSVVGAIAANTDPAVTVVGGVNGQANVWIPDAEAYATQVVIPHWPATVAPAAGSDGHADIIEAASNRIHSFYQLSQDSSGQWHAAQYTWTPLNGSGWGTPADYMQGARAVGVIPIAGVIRAAEVSNGQPMYKHALAMSLANNALSATTPYVFPATSADSDVSTNTGSIPEGARMMIPASFDASTITDARLQKIVRTLQTYGAYVVDRNTGTPYVIYVENNANFNLMPNGWDTGIAAQLDVIRAAIRQVTSVAQWVDANGSVFTPSQNLNLLSMRGPWYLGSGTNAGSFDSWQQAVVFANDGTPTVQTNYSGRNMPAITWAIPQAGQQFTIAASASNGATVKLDLVQAGGVTVFSTGFLGNGATMTFTWPSGTLTPMVTTAGGLQGGGTVSATLVRVP